MEIGLSRRRERVKEAENYIEISTIKENKISENREKSSRDGEEKQTAKLEEDRASLSAVAITTGCWDGRGLDDDG